MAIELRDQRKPATGRVLALKVVTQLVDHSEFTDGGASVGTLDLNEVIPQGAEFFGSQVRVLEGFAGDASAALTIGDGSDVDRYNTGTPSVFADAEDGIAIGVPSGVRFHSAAKTPKLTITVATDWGGVTAGKLLVTLLYFPPVL